MSLNGIDIASYQAGINLAAVPCDFVIIKATQSTNYLNPDFNRAYQQAKDTGKLIGVYHYAGGGGAKNEADYFLSKIGHCIGNAILVLDWETDQNPNFNNLTYAKAFLDRVASKTGVNPMIYMSKSVCSQFDWSGFTSRYALWVAQYANNNTTGYQASPWTDNRGYGAWKAPSIFQYSSHGRLAGWGADLDLNIAYMDRNGWMKFAKGDGSAQPSTPQQPVTKPDKTVDQVAQEVMDGKWGNGDDRKNRLQAAGYDYNAVQAKVNQLSANKNQPKKTVDQLAQEVLAGKWGNGDDRRNRITAAGYDYNAVQNKVNQLSAPAKKSIDQIAQEVLAGKWGNGVDRRNRLQAAGYDYNTVQAKVNALSGQSQSVVYTVKQGDTLSGIAARFGVPMSKIVQLNRLGNPNLIYAGQNLRIK